MSLPRFPHLALSFFLVCQPLLVAGGMTHASASSISSSKETDSQAAPDARFSEGLDLYHLDRYSEAIEIWQEALVGYQSVGDRDGEGKTLGNLGVAHRAIGQYGTAIEFYQQASKIYEDFGDRRKLRQILGNLGNVYAIIGHYEQALEYQQESLRIARELGDLESEQKSLANLGGIYAQQGDYQRAIENYEKSLAIADSFDERETEARVLAKLGSVYNTQGQNFELAIESFQQVYEIAQNIEDQWLEAESLSQQGFAYERLDEFEVALDFYNQSIALFREGEFPQSISMSLNNRAHAQLTWSSTVGHDAATQEQLLKGATSDLTEAISILDALRSNLNVDLDRVSLFDTQVMTYNLLQQVRVAREQYEEALVVSELGRSRPFARLVEERQEFVQSSSSLEQLKAIANKQDATIVEYSLIPEDSVIHQGKSSGPYGGLYVWIVTPEGRIYFEEQELGGDVDLESLIQVSRNSLDRSRAGSLVPVETVQDTDVIFNKKLTELYDILIEPISEYLPPKSSRHDKAAEKVIFIPQGELFLVPFPTLINQEGAFLVEHYTVQTAPSIQSLHLTRQILESRSSTSGQPLRAEDFLIVGNPDMPEVFEPNSSSQPSQKKKIGSLPGAEAEAIAIAGEFEVSQTEVSGLLIGPVATERRVRQSLPNSRIIHLATHGLLEYGDPQASGVLDVPGAIALTADAPYDGLLTAEELQEFDLNADLVVLSACDTGLGTLSGDGVIGLSRSLIAAGAPSVVVSLWSIPDNPTADLMLEFYRQLKQGQDKASALRLAMLKIMDTQEYSDPSAWGAFTLIGEAGW